MSLIVPLAAVPSQSVTATLNGQAAQINVYQKTTGLYLDLLVLTNPTPLIVSGVLGRNLTLMVMDAYLGFVGDLTWVDNSGTNQDPIYTGLGGQFSLEYLFPSEIAALNLLYV